MGGSVEVVNSSRVHPPAVVTVVEPGNDDVEVVLVDVANVLVEVVVFSEVVVVEVVDVVLVDAGNEVDVVELVDEEEVVELVDEVGKGATTVSSQTRSSTVTSRVSTSEMVTVWSPVGVSALVCMFIATLRLPVPQALRISGMAVMVG